MSIEMGKSRLAVIGGASVVLVASIVGFFVFGDAGAEQTASSTTAAASITIVDGDTAEISVPTTVLSSEIAADTATQSQEATTSTVASTGEQAPSTTAPSQSTESSVTFTSSPTVEGEKVGCAEGLVLVGSNGTEPICQPPGQGCPEGYGVIGGVDGALLCKGQAGDVVRVQADGSVTVDTSVPFNGPICQVSDTEGNVVELTLAVDEETCTDRGGEYFPDGL